MSVFGIIFVLALKIEDFFCIFCSLDTLNNFGIVCSLKVAIEFFSEKKDDMFFTFRNLFNTGQNTQLSSIALPKFQHA